jgi:hypothetical protein
VYLSLSITESRPLPQLAGMLRVMPQDWEPNDWGEEQAHRVAQEVRRLRGSRSAQWLSDRTAELGYPVTRSVIADLENGRRRYVTTAELIILAVALNTTPIALMYPGPNYREEIRVMPKFEPLPEVWAVQWFSGMVRSISDLPFDEERRTIHVPNPGEYWENLRRLHRARQMWELDERRNDVLRELGRKRLLKRDGLKDVPDEELSGLAEAAEDLKRRIDELDELGGAFGTRGPWERWPYTVGTGELRDQDGG